MNPTFSMTYIPPNVQPKFTAPRMICVTYESLIPTDWKIVAPYCDDNTICQREGKHSVKAQNVRRRNSWRP